MAGMQINTPRIGVDLGGTKIEAIVMDGDGQITLRERVNTPVGDYEATVRATAGLIATIASRASLGADIPVGMGTPGAISQKTGMMKNCNSTCLNGRPLAEDLAASTGRKVRIANDADCFALSEASDGAGSHARSVFGVILGTGVGGGICYDGRLLEGANAICGEWGHTTLPLAALLPDTRMDLPPLIAGERHCYCGRFDCVESWLSGPAFERSYQLLAGKSLAASEVEQLAQSGDALAGALVAQYCNLLALALSTVINILDPEVIVMGGGMSNMQAIYDHVGHYLPQYVFSDQVVTQIVRHQHGDSSGVRGAAWLWPPAPREA